MLKQHILKYVSHCLPHTWSWPDVSYQMISSVSRSHWDYQLGLWVFLSVAVQRWIFSSYRSCCSPSEQHCVRSWSWGQLVICASESPIVGWCLVGFDILGQTISSWFSCVWSSAVFRGGPSRPRPKPRTFHPNVEAPHFQYKKKNCMFLLLSSHVLISVEQALHLHPLGPAPSF